MITPRIPWIIAPLVCIVGAQAQEKIQLHKQFVDLLGSSFGAKQAAKVKLLSGPQDVKMLRGQSGKVWQAAIGEIRFKITIEDKLELKIEDTFDRIQRLPAVYHRAYQIVSEGNKDGIAFYTDLDGASGHGSQDYLNIIRPANAFDIAHETGHVLEQRARASDPTILDQWKAAIAADKVSVSTYGDTSHPEDLAEFALIHAVCMDAGAEHLDKLKSLSPARFALWERILYPANAADSKPR